MCLCSFDIEGIQIDDLVSKLKGCTQLGPYWLRYVGVVRLIFHVLQLLLMRSTQQNFVLHSANLKIEYAILHITANPT